MLNCPSCKQRIERFNNMLRPCVSRLVRKTLSFSRACHQIVKNVIL
ncbi:IS1 family transposase [Beggiatoa leptomitoformis]|uniref:Transposase n=1 Tax=Beggiatoa leptomitoformis TaxID=288004 RepID=A0A650GRL1_9GAMM|nr:hypothetical protein AL038_19080 [Beggiatoa leptomitoformis]QGX04097.1 hypothetical protein BLE401_12630 [Beggiatoa leptomitoformis]